MKNVKEFETKCKANWVPKKFFYYYYFQRERGGVKNQGLPFLSPSLSLTWAGGGISLRASTVELVMEPASREDSGTNQISPSACENPALCRQLHVGSTHSNPASYTGCSFTGERPTGRASNDVASTQFFPEIAIFPSKPRALVRGTSSNPTWTLQFR